VPPDTVKPGQWGWNRWASAALVLMGWAVRLPPLLDNRFHADEALYAYWGLLIGRCQDAWLATVPMDKPPLHPYLVAGAQALFGSSEFAVRIPGLMAGLLMIPLAAALSDALYGDRWAALGAAVGVALSPFAILFSATAFTDPVMAALGLGSCLAAARGRRGWAGLLGSLAFATKQTGLVWIPLAVGVAQIPNSKVQTPKLKGPKSQVQSPKSESLVSNLQSLVSVLWSLVIGDWSFFLGFLLVLGGTFFWDYVRMGQGAQSFWSRGVVAYGSLRPIWPQELWTRLRGWIELAGTFFVSPLVNGVLLVGLPALMWSAIARRRYTRGALADLFLGSFLLLYLLFHWLWAFPVWDRYLLPLVPLLAILLGRILSLFASWVRHMSHVLRPTSSALRPAAFVICHLSLVIFLILPAWHAAHSRYPVGGDHGAYDGIDQVAAFLRELPEGTVVYHHWLGWHYADYLFDAPVYLAYWPSPAWLARDVRAFGTKEPRYITIPSWESPARVTSALASVGYGLLPVLATNRRDGTRSFTVYHIQPRPDP